MNAIASLWIEGTLTSVEIPAELQAGRRYGMRYAGAEETAPDATFSDYIKAARVGMQWLALIGAMDFASQQQWRTPELRRRALDLLTSALKRPGTQAGQWWQDVGKGSTTADWADTRVKTATSRWLAGKTSADELTEDLLDIQDDAQRRKSGSVTGTPDEQLPVWSQFVRLGCRAMLLRIVADYCEAQGIATKNEKHRVWEKMNQALVNRPPPDQIQSR